VRYGYGGDASRNSGKRRRRENCFGEQKQFALLEPGVRLKQQAEGLETIRVAAPGSMREGAQLPMFLEYPRSARMLAGVTQQRQQQLLLDAEARLQLACE